MRSKFERHAKTDFVFFFREPNTWSHLTLNFHDSTTDHFEHYDSLTIVQYNSQGRQASKKTCYWNISVASGPLPAGWGEDMGLQFQMDIAGMGAGMTEYVDKVTLTKW